MYVYRSRVKVVSGRSINEPFLLPLPIQKQIKKEKIVKSRRFGASFFLNWHTTSSRLGLNKKHRRQFKLGVSHADPVDYELI